MSRSAQHPISLRQVVVACAVAVLPLLSCGREPTGLSDGGNAAVRWSQGIGFSADFPPGFANFQAAGGSGVAFTTVRIVLTHPDGSIALDTVVTFPAGATELPVTLNVPLPPSAPATGIPLALSLKYVNAAGDTVFKGGPVTVTAVPATPGAGPPPPAQVTIPITYTGPGANAVAVRISPRTLTVAPNATFNFSAQALDAGGTVIPNTPIVFNTADPAVAIINAATGAGTAGEARGSVQIAAQLLTGPTDAATLSIVPPPALLALVSGGGQTANVNATLADPVVVRVTATDGVGAPGVAVTFTAGSGGSVGSATVSTDAAGNASTTWRLGGTPGTQSLTVASAGLTGSPLVVTATARALDPARLVVAAQPPASTAAGAAFGLVVRAVDATGILTPAFTGPVTLALEGAVPAGAVLSGTTVVNAVAGVATFADLRLNLPGTYTLRASNPALAGATSNTFDVVAGPAARLVFQAYPIVGAVAGAMLDAITVDVRDAFNNPVTSFTGAVALSLGTAPAGATIGGTATVNAVAGVATFNNIQLVRAGGYTLVAASASLTSATGPAFTITPGSATTVSLVSGGGQSGPGGAALANPIVVKVSDGFGNGVGGVTVTFTPPTGNGTVNPASAVSAPDAGTAQTAWTLGGAAGAKTLNVTATGLQPNPLVVTATATTTSGVARGWTGATSNQWDVATNWSPAGIPGTADDITVPVTATSPTISSPSTIGSLVVMTGATVNNVSMLTIGGSLDAGTTIIGGGIVTMNGASGTLKGNVSGNVTVAAGTYSLIADFNVTGNLTINGTGTLIVDNMDLGVTGDLATAASGRLKMLAGSYVDVTGNATFGGASTSGYLTAGSLYVLGNFTTSGASYAASGSHTLYLNSATGTQTLTFTSPIAGQGINHLVIDQGAAKVMAGTPQIMGDVSLLSNTAPVTGSATVRIGGNFSDATSYVEDTSGGWRVANTEFFGTARTINSGFITSNVVISGSLSFITSPPVAAAAMRASGTGGLANVLNPYEVKINGNLSVTGAPGLLTIGSNDIYVTGDFATTSGGRLSMNDPSAFLGVLGNTTFAGGSTAGLLTAGELFVLNNFTQGGGATSAFAPSADFFTYIGEYYLAASRSARQRAPASMQSPRGARGPVARSAAVTADARAGAEARHGTQQVRLDNARRESAARMARFEDRQRRLASARRMLGAPARRGTFSRSGVTGATQLANSYTGTSNISFANPTSSFFGTLYLAGPEVILLSDITVAGMLQTGISFVHYVRSASPRTVTSHGADVRDLQFDNVRWVLLDGYAVWAMDAVEFYNMDPTVDQFTVARTSDELGGFCDCSPYYYLWHWVFNTTPTSGTYIRATDTNGITVHTLELYMEDPLPTTHEGRVATAGGALISNWPQSFAWTGLGLTDNWTEGANWSTGYQPGSTDNVTIPAGTPRNPVMNLIGSVHNLTIGAGKTIDTNCQQLYVYGNVVAPLAAPATIDCDGDFLQLSGDGTPGGNTVVGNFAAVKVQGNYKVAGTGNQLIANMLQIGSAGSNITVNGGRVDAATFVTESDGLGGGGTLTMNNSADQFFANGAYFYGGSTAGKLTAGTLTLNNTACVLTGFAGSAFAPSGTHKVVFAGTNNCASFADPANSFFQNLDVLAGTTMTMSSAVTVNGTLTRGAGATPVSIVGTGGSTAHLLTTTSLAGFLSGSPTTVSDVKVFLGNGASATFNDVVFSGYDPGFTGSIFSVNRSGGPFTFTGLNFGGAGFAASTGAHFVFNVGPANITISGATPASGSLGTTHITTGGTVSWP